MRPRLQWLRSLVAGCVVLAAVPVSAHAQATPKVNKNPKEAPELKKLVLQGVAGVDQIDLEKSIATTPSKCFSIVATPFCLLSRSHYFWEFAYLDRDEVSRDIVRIRVYYWKHGYRSAEVDTAITPNGNGVTVTFKITEHEPTLVRRIEIDYDSTLIRERRIGKMTLLKAGQPLDLVMLDSMRVMMAAEMWNLGHSDATVDTTITVDPVRRTADVRLKLIPNRATFVGQVVVLGLDKVSQATVLNSITLQPGKPYRQGDVLESQRN